MRRTRIKICGICRVEDAIVAARAGADAIGLVLHPPAGRNVPIELAQEILAALPAFVMPVGLFVNTPPSQIMETASHLRLRNVQLHGNEPPEDIAALMGLTVIKAVRVDRKRFSELLGGWRSAIAAQRLTNLQGLVLETPGQSGGTGVPNDWPTIREHRAAGDFDGLPHFIAAGGLTPENVGAIVRDLRPWAVDVSSGVEDKPREKSRERIEAFIAAVRQADADA